MVHQGYHHLHWTSVESAVKSGFFHEHAVFNVIVSNTVPPTIHLIVDGNSTPPNRDMWIVLSWGSSEGNDVLRCGNK